MDSIGSIFETNKLSESNFHIWKQRAESVLAIRELYSHIFNERVPDENLKRSAWIKKEAKAKAVIGSSVSDEHLEHVWGCDTALAV